MAGPRRSDGDRRGRGCAALRRSGRQPGRPVRRRGGGGSRRRASAPPAGVPAGLPRLVQGRRRARGTLRLCCRRGVRAVRAVGACAPGHGRSLWSGGRARHRRAGAALRDVDRGSGVGLGRGLVVAGMRQPRRHAQRHRAALRGYGADRAAVVGAQTGSVAGRGRRGGDVPGGAVHIPAAQAAARPAGRLAVVAAPDRSRDVPAPSCRPGPVHGSLRHRGRADDRRGGHQPNELLRPGGVDERAQPGRTSR